MKKSKILALVLAVAMIMSTMGIVASADEIPADAVAKLAGTEIYFSDINEAFTEAGNPEKNQLC